LDTKILIRIHKDGVHCWPGQTKYPELAQLHIHHFVILFQVETTGSREIEFKRLRDAVMEVLDNRFGYSLWNFGAMSCEDIATEVAWIVRSLIKEDREVTVTVWEDDEGCAGSVKYERGESIENLPRPERRSQNRMYTT